MKVFYEYIVPLTFLALIALICVSMVQVDHTKVRPGIERVLLGN